MSIIVVQLKFRQHAIEPVDIVISLKSRICPKQELNLVELTDGISDLIYDSGNLP